MSGLSKQQLADMRARLARTEPATGEQVRRALSDALSVGGHSYQPLIHERLRRVEARVPAIVRRLLDAEAERDDLKAKYVDAAATVAEQALKSVERAKVEHAVRDELETAQARIAELEERPLAWAEQLDLKSLDNLLITLGQATEYEPMSGAVAHIHELLDGFRVAASEGGERP